MDDKTGELTENSESYHYVKRSYMNFTRTRQQTAESGCRTREHNAEGQDRKRVFE